MTFSEASSRKEPNRFFNLTGYELAADQFPRWSIKIVLCFWSVLSVPLFPIDFRKTVQFVIILQKLPLATCNQSISQLSSVRRFSMSTNYKIVFVSKLIVLFLLIVHKTVGKFDPYADNGGTLVGEL